jgi:exodeoxyribonuclease VII large subunit
LAETTTIEALSPSELARTIRSALENVGSGWVEGEVQGMNVWRTRNAFFELADEDTRLRCAIWGIYDRLPIELADGMRVQVHFERIDFRGKRGELQLRITKVREVGEGELIRRAVETLAVLRAEGRCEPERKPPLPRFPRRIGLVAGRGSDAYIDVTTHVRERFPAARILLCPARVSGVDAVPSLIDALGTLELVDDVDVIVLARGGGSVADLSCFDDLRLCRAISALKTPVAVALAHTRHRPNAYEVAAAGANVPAKVADLIVPSAAELSSELARTEKTFGTAINDLRALSPALGLAQRKLDGKQQLEVWRLRIDRSEGELVANGERFFAAKRDALRLQDELIDHAAAAVPTPAALEPSRATFERAETRVLSECALERQELGRLSDLLTRGAAAAITRERQRLTHLADLLDARDYLKRGFAAVRDVTGRLRTSAAALTAGEPVAIEFIDGTAQAQITDITTGR